MSADENRALVLRLFDEVWNQGKLAVIDELIAAEYVEHNPSPGLSPGGEGVKQWVSMIRAAFPDVRLAVEDLVVEDDRVAARWIVHGTHQNDFVGIPATGKHASVPHMGIYRLAGGQVVETWTTWDQFGMLQQLGVLPPLGQSTA